MYYPSIDKISGDDYDQLRAEQKNQTHNFRGLYFDNDSDIDRDLPVATAKNGG
jgi:hypothetical protein